LPAKTIFASPFFSTEKKTFFSTFWQKPANPGFSYFEFSETEIEALGLLPLYSLDWIGLDWIDVNVYRSVVV